MVLSLNTVNLSISISSCSGERGARLGCFSRSSVGSQGDITHRAYCRRTAGLAMTIWCHASRNLLQQRFASGISTAHRYAPLLKLDSP